MSEVLVGTRSIGDQCPVFIVAEIGINHNGDVALARRLIDAAAEAGCDAVKFQKRTPEVCTPPEQRDQMRDTPWGYITYLDYRRRVELGQDEYEAIAEHCKERNIMWFASCWDEPSVDFVAAFDPPMYKIASASVTDLPLVARMAAAGRAVGLSTGMSTLEEINAAVALLDPAQLVIIHSNSTYPCPVEDLNLAMITTLRGLFDCPVGYSGHEVGLPTTVAAVALGARYVERHITLDRAEWGSDQAASVEPAGMRRLVSYIRTVEAALGDGIKRVTPGELEAAKRLRRTRSS
jgi:N-acetylneuraminate synthase